jgi:hypothetical protein
VEEKAAQILREIQGAFRLYCKAYKIHCNEQKERKINKENRKKERINK